VLAATVWSDVGLSLVKDKYGAIPDNLLVFTFPQSIELTPTVVWDLCYFVVAIVFVSGVESLLCSRMADRLADNRGVPYNPNKELWGQGWVQMIVVLLNGFPHTGALARTATNIKVGAVSPLAGLFKCFLKLTLAVYLATWLEIVPMACIGGILLYVATAMVKAGEIREVLEHTRFHVALMAYTAVMVIMTDFLTGVLSAIVIWGVLSRFFDRRHPAPAPVGVTH
jgi:MFS superfamily sulfate permease-like transporter